MQTRHRPPGKPPDKGKKNSLVLAHQAGKIDKVINPKCFTKNIIHRVITICQYFPLKIISCLEIKNPAQTGQQAGKGIDGTLSHPNYTTLWDGLQHPQAATTAQQTRALGVFCGTP